MRSLNTLNSIDNSQNIAWDIWTYSLIYRDAFLKHMDLKKRYGSFMIIAWPISWFVYQRYRYRPQGEVMFSQVFLCHNRPHGYWFTAWPCYSAVSTHPAGMLSCFKCQHANVKHRDVTIFYSGNICNESLVLCPSETDFWYATSPLRYNSVQFQQAPHLLETR